MSKTVVQVLKEVNEKVDHGDYLCLQQVIYNYSDGTNGNPCFRFIRRDAQGRMKAQRGQAAIQDLDLIVHMAKKMEKVELKFS